MRILSRRTISTYDGELKDLIKAWLKPDPQAHDRIMDFRKAFGDFVGVKYAIATPNGRSALKAILKGLGLPAGSEVIIPAYEDKSVPDMVLSLGFRPVFTDIDLKTQNISVEQLKKRITRNTSAVIVAHLFGNPAPMAQLKRMLHERNIRLIEDCAHAVGTIAEGQPAGSWGDAAFFSFHLTKPFMTFGGGMAVTNDDTLAQNMEGMYESGTPDQGLLRRMLSAYTLKLLTSKPLFPFTGYPVTLAQEYFGKGLIETYDRTLRPFTHTADASFTYIQALAGLGMLRNLPVTIQKRRQLASILDMELDPAIPRLAHDKGSNIYFYLIFARDVKKIRHYLLKYGIDTGINVMRNLPQLFDIKVDFPNTDIAVKRTVQLPLHEYLNEKDIRWIVYVLNKAVKKFRF